MLGLCRTDPADVVVPILVFKKKMPPKARNFFPPEAGSPRNPCDTLVGHFIPQTPKLPHTVCGEARCFRPFWPGNGPPLAPEGYDTKRQKKALHRSFGCTRMAYKERGATSFSTKRRNAFTLGACGIYPKPPTTPTNPWQKLGTRRLSHKLRHHHRHGTKVVMHKAEYT